MGERIGAYRDLVDKIAGAKPLGRIILKRPFKKRDRGHGLD
jgi:hypothetical protein